jgi:hypothetical protein
MKTKSRMNLNGSLAIGGGALAGLGTGFFFLTVNVFYFVGCLIAGLGAGLIIAALINSEEKVEIKNKEGTA